MTQEIAASLMVVLAFLLLRHLRLNGRQPERWPSSKPSMFLLRVGLVTAFHGAHMASSWALPSRRSFVAAIQIVREANWIFVTIHRTLPNQLGWHTHLKLRTASFTAWLPFLPSFALLLGSQLTLQAFHLLPQRLHRRIFSLIAFTLALTAMLPSTRLRQWLQVKAHFSRFHRHLQRLLQWVFATEAADP